MYFKKLELVGFKSFLNKTVLKFEPGVTAVVGPNGCGKSNVVDAIKWVLGEQSAKSMRSSAMQDVIFNGTEKQEPVNMAEVCLTLSNEDRMLPVDFDEVTIARRLYRTGESEYLLNKTPVRLTDIRNLLMGTGIGTSSYSVVEQGRMDMILSSRPEERRYLFEEASGITRYKTKKREALLKLERTQENLVRVNDIVREVERQIKAIERQARKAERYKARFENLKELDLKFSYNKYKNLSTDDSSMHEEYSKFKERAEELSTMIEEAQTGLADLREEYSNGLDDLQRSQQEIMRINSDIDMNRHTIRTNRERIEELQKFVERLDWEIEEVTGRKDELKTRLDALQTRHSEVKAKRQKKQDEVNAAEETLNSIKSNMEMYRHELTLSREKTVDIEAEQTKTKNLLIKLNADIQNMYSREKRLKMEKRNVELEQENSVQELKSVDEKVQDAKADLENKKKEFDTFIEEYTAKQRKLSEYINERRGKESRLNEIRPRREFLEKLLTEREGMGESVKKIMSLVDSGDQMVQGVHGILSEIVSVRDEYEESIEKVLGDFANAIVVDNRQVADRVTAYLADNSLESASFIILEELSKLSQSGAADPIKKGTIDDITHVLTANEPYSKALKTILRDAFVTVSPEAARMFIDDNDTFRGRIICEKGEVFQRGLHSSRNFSDKEVVPLFGRKEKVEGLIEEEHSLTNEIGAFTARITEIESWLTDSAIRKDNLEVQLRDKQMDYAGMAQRRSSVKEKLDSLTQELAILDSEIEEENSQVLQLKEEGEQLNKRLQELEDASAQLKKSEDDYQKSIHECNLWREETLYLVSDAKAELFGFTKEEESLFEALERERDSFKRIDSEVAGKCDRIKENGERISRYQEEIRQLEQTSIEKEKCMEAKKLEVSDLQARKDRLAETISMEDEKIHQNEKELEALRDKTRDLDIMKKEVEYKRNAIVEKMLDTYKVDISRTEIEIEEDINWEEVQENIRQMREQLDKMGEVSLGAVEEHKQLEERFAFLTKQRDDLESARESLMQAIYKINRTTKKMFMETFEKIKKEFNDYFRMLFNGGKGDIVLQDESNILECGIDIIVRPPGKKLHNIMQLSGGEKAMTAIALIFAIFKVNPSPFCILDEIDAPLDESNIVRFCRVLQEFLKLSQFIIVTHNRMTIQLADVLYGITMEQRGVSKMVSVKFAEEKEAEEEVPVGS